MQRTYPDSSYESNPLPISQDIDIACHEIYKACKGLGTDEEKLTRVLGSKTATERAMLAKRYPELHQKKLVDLIDSETSGDYGTLLELLSMSVEEAEATMIRKSTKGIGTTEKHLYPIVCGRSNADMQVLKKTYFNKYGKDLAVELASELSGDFKKYLMFSLQAMTVDFDPAVHTEEQAEADAIAYYNAGQGKWGTDEQAFFKILCTTPPQHLDAVDRVYSRKYGYTMEKAIKKELSGKTEDAAVYALGMAFKPFDTIAKLFESTMKGLGTDELGLSYCMVRFHHLLPQVMEAYERNYGKSLRDRIHGETSGKYRSLLLALMQSAQSHARPETHSSV